MQSAASNLPGSPFVQRSSRHHAWSTRDPSHHFRLDRRQVRQLVILVRLDVLALGLIRLLELHPVQGPRLRQLGFRILDVVLRGSDGILARADGLLSSEDGRFAREQVLLASRDVLIPHAEFSRPAETESCQSGQSLRFEQIAPKNPRLSQFERTNLQLDRIEAFDLRGVWSLFRLLKAGSES